MGIREVSYAASRQCRGSFGGISCWPSCLQGRSFRHLRSRQGFCIIICLSFLSFIPLLLFLTITKKVAPFCC